MLAPEKLQSLQRILPDVSRETFERLLAYEALFIKWSKAFNLAAPSTLQDFWTRHILDSVQLINMRAPKGVWLDIGSGGGLPGIVVAILKAETREEPIHLVESNGKKAAFLRTSLLETGGIGIVHQCRIEDAVALDIKPQVITARALASLKNLFELTLPWMKQGAIALFHKGREYRAEIKEARDEWQFDLLERPSAIDSASVLLEISALQRKTL